MKSIKYIGLSLVIGIGVSGCGGGSSSSTTAETLTGTFVDAPVEGLSYSTASQKGLTDGNGIFKYKNGETITFKLGTLELGSVPAKRIVTPLTLAGDTSLNSISVKATNIARLLQSLDSDQSDTSKITLDTKLGDMNLTNIDLASEIDLNTIVSEAQNVTFSSYTLKSSENAKNVMISFLQKYLYVGDYSGVSNFNSSLSNYTASQCGSNSSWTIKVSDNLDITGTTFNGTMAISGITLSNSTMRGTTSDGTKWNTVIDEDGKISGTYNWNNGDCVGEISGSKTIQH